MPPRLLATPATVLCALLLALALTPGTTATATFRATAAHRAAAAPAKPRPLPAKAATAAALQGHMAHELTLAGAQSGAYVYDMNTAQVLFSERAQQRRAPASVEKLYTATTALERMGPTARLETTVLGTGRLAPGGVWEGNLYLRGGGDPTFGSESFIRSHYGGVGTTLSTLVTQLADDGRDPPRHGRGGGGRVLLRLPPGGALERL